MHPSIEWLTPRCVAFGMFVWRRNRFSLGMCQTLRESKVMGGHRVSRGCGPRLRSQSERSLWSREARSSDVPHEQKRLVQGVVGAKHLPEGSNRSRNRSSHAREWSCVGRWVTMATLRLDPNQCVSRPFLSSRNEKFLLVKVVPNRPQ